MAKAAGSGCLQVHVNVEENVTKPVILFSSCITAANSLKYKWMTDWRNILYHT